MNILLLSTIYPSLEKGCKGTHVCHYFAREWVKMGHRVCVVHYQAVYPAPFYWMARVAKNKIAAKTSAVVYTKRDRGALFEMDGVLVKRIPLFKPIPHGRFTKSGIDISIREIRKWLAAELFQPDIIVGHFPNPQIEVVSRLKEVWPEARSAIVMHLESENNDIKKVYGKRFEKLCENIDAWGFRNAHIKKIFERDVMSCKHGFVCYSGIPEDYIISSNNRNFDEPLHNFVYVGTMIERKFPLQVMQAINKTYPSHNYQLSYVGEGALLKTIRKTIERNGLRDCVKIFGRIPREEIKEQYDASDCMVMISKGEAYGLVYLEAMSRGCITIASRDEGFDGLIIDGENGFLCAAGDADELSAIICRINALSPAERLKISNNAVATAQSLTDHKAALRYLDDLMSV